MNAVQRFLTVDVSDEALGTELVSQLRLVQHADKAVAQQLVNKSARISALGACGVLGMVWVSVIMAYSNSFSRYDPWSFWGWWGTMITWGFAGLICALVMMLVGAGESSGVVAKICKGLGLISALVLFFPVLPLAAAAAIVASIVFEETPDDDNNALTSPMVLADNRAAEYKSFLAHIESWNNCAEFLNRLRLKIEHNQIPAELVPRAVEGMDAMRAEEKLLLDRVEYMRAIAAEGPLGSKTARGQLGEALVHDLVEPIARMRRELEKLRELDAMSVAQLQVETGKF
jgi:hypothetical protein